MLKTLEDIQSRVEAGGFPRETLEREARKRFQGQVVKHRLYKISN